MNYAKEMRRTQKYRENGRTMYGLIYAAKVLSANGLALLGANKYAETLSGLLRYLKACGVKRFGRGDSAIWQLRDQRKAARVGMGGVLIPPRFVWPWMALVLRVGDAMREATGSPLTLVNLWRPASYNALVASSGIDSDHPNACGADYQFKTAAMRAKGEAVVRALAALHGDTLALSMGTSRGGRKLHVGVLSPRGSRVWGYPSTYKPRRLG